MDLIFLDTTRGFSQEYALPTVNSGPDPRAWTFTRSHSSSAVFVCFRSGMATVLTTYRGLSSVTYMVAMKALRCRDNR